MTSSIIVKVDIPTRNPDKPFMNVFEREIDYDISLGVPFDGICQVFRFIFGNSAKVSVSSFSM